MFRCMLSMQCGHNADLAYVDTHVSLGSELAHSYAVARQTRIDGRTKHQAQSQLHVQQCDN